MTRKKKRTKKKELTAREKLELLIKQGKVLSKPIYEGDTDAKEEKLLVAKNTESGFATVGVSHGMTFSEDTDTKKMGNWFRVDRWIQVHAKPEYIDEVMNVLEDYCVDKLADYYDTIMDLNED